MSFATFMATAKATVKEKSPEICLVGGLLCIGASMFFACKATLEIDKKKEEIKDEFDEAIDAAKDKFDEIDEGVESETLADYTEESAAKDKAIVYGKTANSMIKTGFKVVKAYAPAAGFLATGFTLIILSHKILRDRNATLLAAYAALDAAFKAYRARVIEQDGKAQDQKYMYGTKTEVKEVKRKNPETGEEETVIETEEVPDYPLGSPYARIYDAAHSIFYQNADPGNMWNEGYLEQLQETANSKLQRHGYVFLNEVYEMLGFEPTPEGQIVGWVRDNPDGDGYIDFGIKLAVEDPRFKDFIEPKNLRRKIVLDFNVDGPILDKITWRSKGKNDLSEAELNEIREIRKKAEDARKGLYGREEQTAYDELEDERYAKMNK